MRIHKRPARSLSEFNEIVNELLAEWHFSPPEVTVPWFRGQQNAAWSLVPKFNRLVCRDFRLDTDPESELREEFQIRASLLVSSRPDNDWAWYVLMQHHGAATRLLDWTEASQVALHFAVRQATNESERADVPAAVFALDPYELNGSALHKKYVYPVGDPLASKANQEVTRKWLPQRFKGRPSPVKTCAVSSPHLISRMAVQRSCFTVAGANSLWLEGRQAERFVRKILIPAECVVRIRRELEVSGVDESTVFPDLDGLGRTLTHKWLHSKPPRDVLPHTHVYARLRPSARHGVGVFAIRKIPSGVRIFEGDDEALRWISKRSIRRLPRELQRLYDDFAVAKDGKYGCPRNFNLTTLAWYLNESKTPNVRCDSHYDFFAAREIRAGEELTVDYSSYSDPPQR